MSKFPLIWGICLAFTSFYAFFGRQVFGAFFPVLGTESGWLLSFIVLGIAVIVLMVVFNIIEGIADAEIAEQAEQGRGHGH